MDLRAFSEEMLPAIETELHRAVQSSISGSLPDLLEMMTYHLGWTGEGAGKEAQGKRIRPLLVLLSAAAAGGDWRSALPAAAAVELIHNFSLIHDDIEDHSPLRRGRPPVWTIWGVPHAINAGDTMFTLAQLAVLTLSDSLPPDHVLQAAQCLNRTCLDLTQGQYLDMSYENRCDLELKDYWPMVSGKTASLLGCCTELGAISADLPTPRQAAFRQFGISLGLAFQSLDDWLGIWGDSALTGKSTESDLVSGKKSLPVLFGLGQSGRFAQRWAQGPITNGEVRQLAGWLSEDGAETYTRETADRLTAEALSALDQAVEQESSASAALRQLAGMLLQRKN